MCSYSPFSFSHLVAIERLDRIDHRFIMKLSITDAFWGPQPPSFNKKKSYELHRVLGTGTFGKVVVCRSILLQTVTNLELRRELHGMFRRNKSPLQKVTVLI